MTDLIPLPDPDERHVRPLEDMVDDIAPARAARILFWVIGGFFTVALLWAAFAEIDRTVRGMGRVISSSELQVVSSFEPGVLEDILVHPGQLVKVGQPLLRLDPTASDAELGSTSAAATALDMKIARLTAEIAGRAPSFPAPADVEAARQLEIERALYQSRQANLSSLIAAGRAQITRASQGVAQARAEVASAASQRAAADSELAMIKPLVDQGIEPRLSLIKAQNAAASGESDYARAQASLGEAQAAQAEASANLSQMQQDWRAQAASELAMAQADSEARRSALPALEERVARTNVRSPIEGKVSRVLVATRGSAVASGAPLVEIVPSRDTLLIEARILPKDIGSVRIGQKAKIGITAYDSAVYGSLTGRVSTISADSIVEERTGEIYYLVRVVSDGKALVGPGGQKLEIGSGMLADVALLGDKRTVLQYIFTPVARLSERAFRE